MGAAMTVDWDRVAELADTRERDTLEGRQCDSLAWIVERLRQSKGVVLADEVGTGKTRIACAVIHAVIAAGGRVATVVPRGLIHQWVAESRVLDMNLGYGLRHLRRKIDDFQPDLVGVSLISLEYRRLYRLLSEIKRMSGATKIVVGGPHVTILRQKVLEECPAIDYGVVYEFFEFLNQYLFQLEGSKSSSLDLINEG